MTEFIVEQDFLQAKEQRKKTLAVYIVIAAVYALISLGLFLWYRTMQYASEQIATVKAIHYSITALMVLFSFIYLGIKFKRINRYYDLLRNLMTGRRETSTGSFLEYDETPQEKDGVDCKALIFVEWNKYKNDFFERKVLVLYEKPYPEIPESANVRYVTQGNVLVSYEIL